MNLVKESLAKLLAQEDLIVENRPVETAQFNVETRVLTLPIWEHDQAEVIDSLIAHEVGHALYTPNEWDFLGEVPMQFVNCIEDVRIEKLMKRRYEGIPKTFYRGYKVLADQDFFQIQDKDIDLLNFIDRINLQYKIGNFVDVDFSDEEKPFLDKCDALETFEDVIELSKEICAFMREQWEKQQEEKEEEIELPSAQADNDITDGDNELEDLSEGRTPQPSEGKEDDKKEGETPQPKAAHGKEVGRNTEEPQEFVPTVETLDALNDGLKSLANAEGQEYDYIELPKTISSKFFVSNKEVSDLMNEFYTQKENLRHQKDFSDQYELHMAREYTKNIDNADAEYRKFKPSQNKEVNYLVKEFEMKKAADSYARATTSRTGVLDTTKLHTYKYNDDIFRKVTTIPEGKNHGLIFNVDWSGSMSNCIQDTVKQVLTLVSFCRKVGIAYDVYLFSDNYEKDNHKYHEDAESEGKVILRDFRMLNVLSSGSNNRSHDRQAQNLFRLASSFKYHTSCGVPHKMNLGGTPLNEAVVSLNHIIPSFKKRTGSQKVHVINLTDGEGYTLRYGKKVVSQYDGEVSVVSRNCNPLSILRDRQTGKQYKFVPDRYDQTDTFIYQLRDRFPECEFMNIRLITGNDWYRFKRSCLGYEYDGDLNDNLAWADADREWKKTRSFICLSSAYTVQYALAISALNTDDEFTIEKEDPTKAEIKRAFTKSLKGKKMNKKILSSFIDRIA